MTETKKLSVLRVYEILSKYSDYNHPLLQEDIRDKLFEDYGMEIERKAVGRNISFLKEAGIDIISSRKGSYLVTRLFTDAELRLLIDSILSSRYINKNNSLELIDKLSSLTSIYFKPSIKLINLIDLYNKFDNKELFYTIEMIDEAISSHRMISFTFNMYKEDLQLHPIKKYQASPFNMLVHNQKYYLCCKISTASNLHYFRLDRLTDIKLTNDVAEDIKSLSDHRNGIDYGKISSSFPYLYSDEPVTIRFEADRIVLDQIVDWFGHDIIVSESGDEDRLTITVKTSPKAMENWALQYAKHVKVLSPKSLVAEIKKSLQIATGKYN